MCHTFCFPVPFYTNVQTQCFITAMDALKLEQRAVDEVQPLIYDLSDRLNKVRGTFFALVHFAYSD